MEKRADRVKGGSRDRSAKDFTSAFAGRSVSFTQEMPFEKSNSGQPFPF